MHNQVLSTLSPVFVVPLFSCSYELLFPQALYFDNDLRCPGVYPLCLPSSCLGYLFSITYGLCSSLCSLFAHACLCFQRVTDSFAKTPGVGGSTRPGTQRRARGQRARAHAEAWAERRRHVAQGIAAARAAAFVAERAGGVGAQPLASRLALRINALHGEAGQKLHVVFPHRPLRLCGDGP